MMKFYDRPLISFFKNNFFYSVIKPAFFFCGILNQFFCALYFFVFRDFFGGRGITDLKPLFLAIPFVSIIILPSLCANNFLSSKCNRNFISDWKIILVRIINVCIQYFLIQLMLLFIVELVNQFGSIDFGQVWTSFIFILFYGFCVSSICVFIFQTIDSIVLAFAVCAVSLGCFTFIHFISVQASSLSLLSLVVRSLSFYWHFNDAAGGVLSSKDIFFFLITGFLFLYLAVAANQFKKGLVFNIKRKVNFVLFIFLFVLLYVDCFLYVSKKDYSLNQTRTLSDFGKKILSLREEPLSITYYRSKRIFSVFPTAQNVKDFLLEYCQEGISVTEVDADSEENKKILQSYGIYPQNIKIDGNNKAEFIGVHSAIVLEYLDRYEYIPFIISTDTLEYEMNGRLLHLFTQKERTVNIIVANGLSLDDNYEYIIPFLSSQGFRCNLIDINEGDILNQIKGDDKLFMLIGSSMLSFEQCQEIEQLLSLGFHAIFMTSPFETDLINNWSISLSKNQNFIDMLSSYGINWTGRLIRDLSCCTIRMDSDTNADGSKASSVQSQFISYMPWPRLFPQKNAPGGLSMFWPAEIDFSKCENAHPYLYSSPKAKSEKQTFNSYGSLFETYPFDFYGANIFAQDQFALSCEVNGKVKSYFTDQMIDISFLLIPDQYFVHSWTIGYSGGFESLENFNFLISQLLKMNGENEMAQLHDRAYFSIQKGLYKISDEKAFKKAKKNTYIISFALIPCLFILVYLVLFIFRKYRINKMVKYEI